MLRWLICLIVLGSVALSPIHARQATSDAPYLYYFSDVLNAFVIERADGTDTRILGKDVMKSDYGFVLEDVVWSPDGQWLAWLKNELDAPTRFSQTPYAIRADGSRTLTSLEGLYVDALKWSPDGRLLFAAGRAVLQADPDMVRSVFVLIDVETDRRIVDVQEDVLVRKDVWRGVYITWLNSEHVLVEYYEEIDEQALQRRRVIRLFSRDGRFEQFRLPNAVALDPDTPDMQAASAKGWIVNQETGHLIATNLLTGVTYQFPYRSKDQLTIHWSPNGESAILWSRSLDAGPQELLVLTLDNPRLMRFSDEWTTYGLGRSCSAGDMWSADGNYAVFDITQGLADSEFKPHSVVLDVANARLQMLYTPPIYMECGVRWQWSANRLVAVVAQDVWENTWSLLSFDLLTRTSDIRPTQYRSTFTFANANPFAIIDDLRFIAYMDDGAVIYDTRTGTIQSIRPASNGFASADGGYVKWHPSGDWLLTFDFAQAQQPGQHVGIVNHYTGELRDLSYQVGTRKATDWLPLQVNPADLPPPINKPLYPSPQQVLPTTDWILYLTWSPDGEQIAAGTDQNRWGTRAGRMTVFDVATGNQQSAFSDLEAEYRVEWKPSASGYIPELSEAPTYSEILTTSADGTAEIRFHGTDNNFLGVFDSATDSLLCELGRMDYPPTAASFSADGRYIATSSAHSPITLWDRQECRVVMSLSQHSPALAFSPDSSQLATVASWNVQIWDVNRLLELHLSVDARENEGVESRW
jgi:WD40 repeat protein